MNCDFQLTPMIEAKIKSSFYGPLCCGQIALNIDVDLKAYNRHEDLENIVDFDK